MKYIFENKNNDKKAYIVYFHVYTSIQYAPVPVSCIDYLYNVPMYNVGIMYNVYNDNYCTMIMIKELKF